MTFQRATALQIVGAGHAQLRPDDHGSSSAATIRALRPTRTQAGTGIDFIVRGEGEQTFRELLRALEPARP